MSKIASMVIAVALVVIAVNMTVTNIKMSQKEPMGLVEKVVPVVGRAYSMFDGLGVSTGFLVRDGQDLKMIPYGPGSMAANDAFQPKYLTVVWYSDGQIACTPLEVTVTN